MLQINYSVFYKIIIDLPTFSILFQWNISKDAEKFSGNVWWEPIPPL